MPWSDRLGRKVVAVALSATLVVACANPLSDGDDADPQTSSPTSTPAATATRAAVMPIVTPTPIPAGATVTAPEPGGSATTGENPETYVVEEGDTLYEIALRFGVEIRAIIELNGLSDPNDIQAGQELRIPPRQ